MRTLERGEMDPLHKIDSAISVASKDNGILDASSGDYQSPSCAPVDAHAPSDRDHSEPVIEAGQEMIPALAGWHPEPTPISVSQVRPSSAQDPVPLPNAPRRRPPPTSVDHSGAPGCQPRPRSLTPPTHAVHPEAVPATADSKPSSSSSHTAPVILSAPDDRQEREQEHQQQEREQECKPEREQQNQQECEQECEQEQCRSQQAIDALIQSGTGSIAVDHDQLELESDPGYESDRASFASTSLSSSMRDYLFENGRRYHRFREGRYNFPNDEPEQDREDMKHVCVKLLCQQQLYFAPIDQGQLHNILDIGTGTGIWAIEMGDQFPSANVLGIDLSPIQPDWVPSNVRFEVDDAESQWVHPLNHFDYIHTRHTVMAIKDWPKLYRTAKEHLRPGGWIESQEIYHYPISANNSMPLEHPVAQYWALIHQGLNRLGIDFQAAAGGKIATMMREAGFENVHERILHVPLGTWPKHPDLKAVGEYWRHILLVGAQAIALGPLTRGCGWTRDQVEVFLIELRKAYLDNSCLMYMPMYVTYGQKPE